MKQGILIVGGGILQIPALLKAKQLGLVTFLTDGSDRCIARNYADHFFLIDVIDVERTAELAKQLKNEGKIEAVYTQGADLEYTVAFSATTAGLFSIGVDAALNCKSKVRMRKKLNEQGIENIKFGVAKNIEEFKTVIANVGFPCYVKPVDNSASRGVRKLTDPAYTEEAFYAALNSCMHSKEVLVEEEIPGNEYSVDTVLFEGKLYPAGISDRGFLEKNEFAVQKNSTTPSLIPESYQLAMYNLMSKAANALGVFNGAFKGDLVIDERDHSVKIIEVAARTSGGFDSQYRKPYSFGIDVIKATMDIARGLPLDPVDLIPKWIKWSRTFSIFNEEGTIKEIIGVEEAKKIPGVKNIFLLVKVGDKVQSYIDCAKRTNHIIIVSDKYEDLEKIEEQVRNTIKINMEKK